jgi:DNA-binding response OmpR family regulator
VTMMRILIVEDEEHVAQLAADIIGRESHAERSLARRHKVRRS